MRQWDYNQKKILNHAAPEPSGPVADMKNISESDLYTLIEQHQYEVGRFIRMTVKNQWVADDLTQETFIRAFKKIDSLKDVSRMKSWLMQVAYHLCLDYFRSSSKNRCDEMIALEEVIASQSLPVGKQLERDEMSRCVQEKMLLLPHSYRTILYLSDIAGLTYGEIADVLELNRSTMKIRLHRARKKLREILTKQCDFGHDERAVLTCLPK